MEHGAEGVRQPDVGLLRGMSAWRWPAQSKPARYTIVQHKGFGDSPLYL